MLNKIIGPSVRRALSIVLLLTAAAIALKFVYLKTAESNFNAEELPLAALTLVGDVPAQANIATTRLYGTAPITTALSLEIFGFTPLGLKFPSMLFFFLSLIFLALLSRRVAVLELGTGWLLPSALLILGPPVIQIWGMKNRGGFIETICALVICLWICSRKSDGPLRSVEKLILALVVGLAIWSQPIAMVWGLPVCAYVLWQDARFSPKTLPASICLLLAGIIIGVLPLINMNYLFNFNTFAVLSHGEVIEGVDLGRQGRIRELLTGGVPRLLGLKEQWGNEWVIWAPLARILYGFLLLPGLWASFGLIRGFLRDRRLTVELLLLAVGVLLVAANIISSWGNFQLEPRRLLLLYVPFAVLTALGLLQLRKLLVPYLLVWVALNAWTNYVYISKHPNGFSHAGYQRLEQIAAYLKSERIKGVYTDVWTGGRVTFASLGHIPWYASPYEPSIHGYIGDDVLNVREAMLFNLNAPSGVAGRQAFASDVANADIHCKEALIQNIAIFSHCSREIELRELGAQALANQLKPGSEVLVMDVEDDAVKTLVGIKRQGALVSTGQAGFLMFGPYRTLPAGSFTLEVIGRSSTPLVLDVTGRQGEVIFAERQMRSWLNAEDRSLARMDLDIERAVSDLEVRVRVPAGSDTQIDGYRIIAR